MPHKLNAGRQHKFAASRDRVTSWRGYNEALRRRGDVTVWFDDGKAGTWKARRCKDLGGKPVYSDVATEVCLSLRSKSRLPRRQLQGFTRSLLRLMDLELPTPEISTLSRRSKGLKIVQDGFETDGAITLIADSTGLRIHRGSAGVRTNMARTRHGNPWRWGL